MAVYMNTVRVIFFFFWIITVGVKIKKILNTFLGLDSLFHDLQNILK